jgi:phage antirepressor YoqD-like protein
MKEQVMLVKTFATRELATQFGCDTKTVLNWAEKVLPDKVIEHGKPAYWTEAEATVLLEAIKNTKSQNDTLKVDLQSMETELTPILQMEILLKQKEEIDRKVQAIKDAEIERLKRENAVLQPKADFYDAVADSKDVISMRDVAAILDIPGMGRNNLFALLRERGVLDERNIPYRKYQERGYFRVVEGYYEDSKGERHPTKTTYVYQSGLAFINRILGERRIGL